MNDSITGKWLIDLPELSEYIVGSDKLLYKLPYVDKDGYSRALRRIKLVQRGSAGYWIKVGDKSKWFGVGRIQKACKLIPEQDRVILK